MGAWPLSTYSFKLGYHINSSIQRVSAILQYDFILSIIKKIKNKSYLTFALFLDVSNLKLVFLAIVQLVPVPLPCSTFFSRERTEKCAREPTVLQCKT